MTTLEELRRREVIHALTRLEEHLLDAAAEVARQRTTVLAAPIPAPENTYAHAGARAHEAVITALANAGLGSLVLRTAEAEVAREATRPQGDAASAQETP